MTTKDKKTSKIIYELIYWLYTFLYTDEVSLSINTWYTP